MIAPANAPTAEPAADAAPPVDLALRIETPENVVLNYTLAGPTLRAAAYLIDLTIRTGVIFGALMVVTCASAVTPGTAMGFFLLLLFAFSWGYYTLFEAFWNGRTPGKWTVGLRVIQDKGYPITFWASAGRNMIRAADSFGLYGVGFVTMLLNPRFKRLGDLLARTVVVCERSVVLPREPVIIEKIDPLPRDEVPGTPPSARTLALIDGFLGRRHAVSIPRGHEIARPLAVALAARLRFSGDRALVEKYPMAFLARVYVTFMRRDQEDEAESRPAFAPRRNEPPPAPPEPVFAVPDLLTPEPEPEPLAAETGLPSPAGGPA